MTAVTTEDKDDLAAAKATEKEARRLRRAGCDEEAIATYDHARELYAEFAYGESDLAKEARRANTRCNAIASNIRRPKTQRPPATTPRPDCLSCDKPLRRYKFDDLTFKDGTPREWGDYGDNRFCGLRCGWSWACKHTSVPKSKKGTP